MAWDTGFEGFREHYANGGKKMGVGPIDNLIFSQEQSKIEKRQDNNRVFAALMSEYRDGRLSNKRAGRNPIHPFVIGDKIKLVENAKDSRFSPLWNGTQGKIPGTIVCQNLNSMSKYTCRVEWDNGTENNYMPEQLMLIYDKSTSWKSWHTCTICKKKSPFGYGPTKRESIRESILIMVICGWHINCDAKYNPQGMLDFLIEDDILCSECKSIIRIE